MLPLLLLLLRLLLLRVTAVHIKPRRKSSKQNLRWRLACQSAAIRTLASVLSSLKAAGFVSVAAGREREGKRAGSSSSLCAVIRRCSRSAGEVQERRLLVVWEKAELLSALKPRQKGRQCTWGLVFWPTGACK